MPRIEVFNTITAENEYIIIFERTEQPLECM